MNIPNLDELIMSALREDIGYGDHSTLACIPSDYQGKAQMKAKADGIICGIEVGKRVFELVDANTLTVDGVQVFYSTRSGGGSNYQTHMYPIAKGSTYKGYKLDNIKWYPCKNLS